MHTFSIPWTSKDITYPLLRSLDDIGGIYLVMSPFEFEEEFLCADKTRHGKCRR